LTTGMSKFEAGLSPKSTLLTVEDVAELLRVPVTWVYERTRQRGLNRLPGFRLGKYWRFREAEVFAWLERQRAGGHTCD
jgi:excisionase family DNA binding protein